MVIGNVCCLGNSKDHLNGRYRQIRHRAGKPHRFPAISSA
jgi:hypothetical protein